MPNILDTSRIAFVGAGNMASSLIAGFIAMGVKRDRIAASSRRLEQRDRLKSEFGIEVFSTSTDCVVGADIVVLSVKPQGAESVCTEIAPSLSGNALVVSIAAGVSISSLRKWLTYLNLSERAIVRCMPNTPVSIGQGVSALFANSLVTHNQRALIHNLMCSTGQALWLDDEDQFDAVTALSGSGPAYTYLLMEAMIQAGKTLGLSAEIASALTLQTVLGAAKLATSGKGDDVVALRRQVTSPRGTTEAAVDVLQMRGFESLVVDAIQAAAKRSGELQA